MREKNIDHYEKAELDAWESIKKFCLQILDEPREVEFTEIADLMKVEMQHSGFVMTESTRTHIQRKM